MAALHGVRFFKRDLGSRECKTVVRADLQHVEEDSYMGNLVRRRCAQAEGF